MSVNERHFSETAALAEVRGLAPVDGDHGLTVEDHDELTCPLALSAEFTACADLQLDAPAMRKLQFLLFEAISNELQHAHAKVLRFEAAMHGRVLRLALIDDGCGFDARRPPRALLERARAIGARLTLESVPGCTVVQLEFDT